MKILALDTAMAACSVAVVDTAVATPLAAAFVPMERGHAEALPPMIEQVMRQSGLAFSDIDRIAVTLGPGTFTGVRIGLAMARGLGLALGIPVIGIDTLSAIAANAAPAAAELLVVADARNEEVYAATFDPQGICKLPPAVVALASAASGLRPATCIIGTAAASLIAASGRSDLVYTGCGDLPVAGRFAKLAMKREPDGMPSPLYLRAPDAKPQQQHLRPASAVSIVEAGAESAELLASIHAEAFETPWPARSLAELLAMPGATACIALERGEPAGFILTRRAADEAEIIVIATRPSMQRRGIGAKLLASRLPALQAESVRLFFLEVAEGNAAARALYKKLGFSVAGVRKGYYSRTDGRREDAIIMRRELSA